MMESDDLPSKFFAEARLVFQLQKAKIDFRVEDVCSIADDPAMTSAFVQKFRSVNDPDLRGLIIDYLYSVAGGLQDASDRTDVYVELLDRAGLTATVGATVAAVGLVITTGGAALAPIIMLGVGMGGTAACGFGRTQLKFRSLDGKSASRKVAGLADRLKNLR